MISSIQARADKQSIACAIFPRLLQTAYGQIVVNAGSGNFGSGAGLGLGVGLAQNAAAQAQQTLAASQNILLAGQVAALPQGGAVHGHTHVGGVVGQAHKQVIPQPARPGGIGPQQVLRSKHPRRAVQKFMVQLVLAPGQRVHQPHGGRVNAYRVGTAVHAIHGGHPQHGQPHAGHIGQKFLVRQHFAGRQRVQRNAASQRLAVDLKQPIFDQRVVLHVGAALQKYIFFAVLVQRLHHTYAGQIAPVVASQRQVAIAPDRHKMVVHHLQKALAAD